VIAKFVDVIGIFGQSILLLYSKDSNRGINRRLITICMKCLDTYEESSMNVLGNVWISGILIDEVLPLIFCELCL
jgi:hypothetical protein